MQIHILWNWSQHTWNYMCLFRRPKHSHQKVPQARSSSSNCHWHPCPAAPDISSQTRARNLMEFALLGRTPSISQHRLGKALGIHHPKMVRGKTAFSGSQLLSGSDKLYEPRYKSREWDNCLEKWCLSRQYCTPSKKCITWLVTCILSYIHTIVQ